MTKSLGRIVASLAEPTEIPESGLIDRINSQVQPPEDLTLDDVYVRAMFIVSDRVNSFGGRFPAGEHQHLVELLVDSPVLVGHRKDKLPIARTFHAETVRRHEQHWVKSYFYWLRSADNAEDLLKNIDGGIYKECSIAFTFSLPECSICGQDIRLCEHEPFGTYDRDGAEDTCHFNYRRIERVLETSLVYRGANPGTTMSKQHDAPVGSPGIRTKKLTDLGQLDPHAQYIITPRYEGIPVTARAESGKLILHDSSGRPLALPHTPSLLPETLGANESELAVLVGCRGKERCSRKQVTQYVNGESSNVTRLVLHLHPHPDHADITQPRERSRFDIRTIPYRRASLPDIPRKASEITTRLGVNIRSDVDVPGRTDTYYCHPDLIDGCPQDGVGLSTIDGSTDAFLSVTTDALTRRLRVTAFDQSRWEENRLFIAREIAESQSANVSASNLCKPHECSIRPARLKGESVFVLRKLPGEVTRV